METYYVPPIILNWKTDWDYNFFIPEYENETFDTRINIDYFKYRSEKIAKKGSLANFRPAPTIETATGQAMLSRGDLDEMIDYDCKLMTDDETAILFTLRFEQNDVKLRLYLS